MNRSEEILRLIKLRIQILYFLQEPEVTLDKFTAIGENLEKINSLMAEYHEAMND